MPQFICKNKKCPSFDIIRTEFRTTSKIDKNTGNTICAEQICPDCNTMREDAKKDGFTTHMGGGKNVCKK